MNYRRGLQRNPKKSIASSKTGHFIYSVSPLLILGEQYAVVKKNRRQSAKYFINLSISTPKNIYHLNYFSINVYLNIVEELYKDFIPV